MYPTRRCTIGGCVAPDCVYRGLPHSCRTCGAINAHRTADCPRTTGHTSSTTGRASSVPPRRCTVSGCDADECRTSGLPHRCRSCGSENSHRTANCPRNTRTVVTGPIVITPMGPAILQAPINPGIVVMTPFGPAIVRRF